MATEDRAPINWTVMAAKLMVVMEIVSIVLLLFAFGNYVWHNLAIGAYDNYLQIAIVAAFLLAGTLWVNRTIAKRW